MDEALRRPASEVVEPDQALTKPVAAAASGQDETHRCPGNLPVRMADERLDRACIVAPASSARSRSDPLLVSTAQKERDQLGIVEKPGPAQRIDQQGLVVVRACPAGWQP